MLLFFISGPSVDDVKNLRTIAFVVALLALVATSLLLFTSAGIFTLGPTDIPDEGAAGEPEMDEEEVMLEEYLGLSEEAATQEVNQAGRGASSGTAAESGRRAKFCYRCGSRLMEAGEFCHSCGAPVAEDPSPPVSGGQDAPAASEGEGHA